MFLTHYVTPCINNFFQTWPFLGQCLFPDWWRNHIQLARFLLRIERFDKTLRKHISHAIKKTICKTFKNHALKITVTRTVRLCEIQRKRCKGRLTLSHNRWCAYNSELRWKLKPPSALGYLIMANFRTLKVFPCASSGKFLFTLANT